MQLKTAEELKWRKGRSRTTELESDLFIVSLKGERDRAKDCSKLQSERAIEPESSFILQ